MISRTHAVLILVCGFSLQVHAQPQASARQLASPPSPSRPACPTLDEPSGGHVRSREANLGELRVVRSLLAELPANDERRPSTLFRLGMLQQELARFLSSDARAHRGTIASRRLEAQAAEARARVIKTWAYLAHRYPHYDRSPEGLVRVVAILVENREFDRARAVTERLRARYRRTPYSAEAMRIVENAGRCTLDAER